MHTADEPEVRADPVQQHRPASRVVDALIAFGSTPAMRCWSGHWWLPPQTHGRPVAETDVTSRPRRRRNALGALTVVTALVLAACSSGDDDDAEPTSTTVDATTTTASEAAAGTDGFVLDEELDPGTYQSENFLIPISVTVPAGWEIFEDEPGQFGLDVVAHPEPPVLVIRDVAASALGCVEGPAEGVGTTAAEIADALANREGIVASDPEPVSIGGLDGVVLDVELDPSWTQGCPFTDGEPTVSTLIGNAGASAEFFWGVMADSSQRIYLLDVGKAQGGGNLLVMVETCCGVTQRDRIAESTPVVESLRFFDGG